MEQNSENEYLEKKKTNNQDILSVSFHSIKSPKVEGLSPAQSVEKLRIKSQPSSELQSPIFLDKEKEKENEQKKEEPKKKPEQNKDNNDIFMSQFMSGMDKESDELFKMIKGVIDEDPSQKALAQKAINETKDIINTTDTIIASHQNKENTLPTKYDLDELNKNVEDEIAKQNALLENKNPENKTDEKVIENPPYEPELDELREKVEEKLEKMFEKNQAERQAQEAERDRMNEDKKESIKIDFEEELYETLDDDFDEVDIDDILNSGANIDWYFPKYYQPNFESPIFTIIATIMEKYGFSLISDMIIRNDKNKRIIVEKKVDLNEDLGFDMNINEENKEETKLDNEKKEENNGNNGNDEVKEDELNQAQMDIEPNLEDKKEENKEENILNQAILDNNQVNINVNVNIKDNNLQNPEEKKEEIINSNLELNNANINTNNIIKNDENIIDKDANNVNQENKEIENKIINEADIEKN